MYENIKIFFRNLFILISHAYKQTLSVKNTDYPLYQIIEIDPNRNDVIIKSLHSAVIIRDKIPKILKNSVLLSGINSVENCYLGYYYGRMMSNARPKLEKFNFLIRNTRGRYKITSLNRDNTINYLDTHNQKSYQAIPFDLARDEYLIEEFDPSQACYVGILAGLMSTKTEIKKSKLRPHLRIVK